MTISNYIGTLKMLNLEEIERTALQSNKALSTTPEGYETLLGLTVAESEFLLAVEKDQKQNVGAAESPLYHRLRQLHANARQLRILNVLRTGGRKKDLS